jgi:hypothetical protein
MCPISLEPIENEDVVKLNGKLHMFKKNRYLQLDYGIIFCPVCRRVPTNPA